MLIVYGSKILGKKDLVHGWGHCESCGEYTRRKNYTGRKWGYLYYIPIIPCGGRIRVVNECAKCGYGFHVADSAVSAMTAGISKSADKAMNALAAGAETFIDDDNATEPCLATLMSQVELFHGLGSTKRVEWVLKTLEQKGLTYEHAMVRGVVLELQGELPEAQTLYKQLVASHPDDREAHRALGAVSMLMEDYPSALTSWERVFDSSEDRDERLMIRQIFIAIHEATQQWDKAVEQYEKCFEFSPKLAKDKKLKKAYKKTLKKSQLGSPYRP
jgi:tetratricopeptide (TPR) repeat protein